MTRIYVASIEYRTPQLAGIYKDNFDFRVFRKGNLAVVLYKYNMKASLDTLKYLQENNLLEKSDISDIINLLESKDTITVSESISIYRRIKKLLEKEKFASPDFLFQRDADLNIDLHKTLVRPIYFVLSREAGWDVSKVLQIIPYDVKYGLYYTYVGATKSPVIYETIEKGSIVKYVFESSKEGEPEHTTYIGRARRFGFGAIKITVEPVK